MLKHYTYVASLVAIAALSVGTIAAAQTMSNTSTSTDNESTTTDQMNGMSSDASTTDQNQGIQFGSGQPQDTTVAPSVPLVTPTASYPAPMITEIDESSHALIRGTVTQVASDSITLNSWGNSWTVRMAGGGTVIPAGIGGMSDLSGIHTGDFVGVEGSVILGQQSGMIEATLVRDWTTNPYVATTPETLPVNGVGTGSSTTNSTGSDQTDSGQSDSGTSAGNETTNPTPQASY